MKIDFKTYYIDMCSHMCVIKMQWYDLAVKVYARKFSQQNLITKASNFAVLY